VQDHRRVPLFLLHHSHDRAECGAAAAAWRGFASPLRGTSALSTCLYGGHEIWWRVRAEDREAALRLLPPYVASRTEALRVREVPIR
jgi:hypothetical protein